jgi:flagellar hook-associated protein 2
VNGIAMTSTSNTVTNAIQGVNLTLNSITATPASLTVTHDTKAVTTAISGFVDAYNALYNQLKTRSAYGNATTAGGQLAGDGTVRLMMDQLRSIFMTGASGGVMTSLSQAGVTTQTDGTLKLDSVALGNAMASNYSDVTNLFSSATGFATRLNTWASSVLTPGGVIDSHVTSLNTTITNLNDQISQLERRMTVLQAQYTKQFTNLNMMLSSMNNTSAYISQQLAKTGA